MTNLLRLREPLAARPRSPSNEAPRKSSMNNIIYLIGLVVVVTVIVGFVL